MHKFIKCFTVAVALAVVSALDLSAGSYSQSQVDTNRLTFASTNYYNVPSDVNTNPATSYNASTNQVLAQYPYIDLGLAKDSFIQFGGFCTNSTANPSNITMTVLWTCDFANWGTNVGQFPASRYTLTVPGSSTNWCFTEYAITNSPPGCTLRSAENANTSVIGVATNSLYLKVVQKLGI